MKNPKLWLILLATATILCACGEQEELISPILPEEDSFSSSENEAVSPLEDEEDFPTNFLFEDDTVAPEEGMVRSRLTNEWVDEEVANIRPIAVMIPNEVAAIPHYSLSNASILYEANVEGRMTRLLAIYENWQDLEQIGNIRSLRTYYAYWAFEWDAFLIHFGGPFFIDYLLAEETTQNVNGLLGDDEAFFRTDDREAPHNAYASGAGIKEVINRKGYTLSYRDPDMDNHFQFTPKAEPNTLEQYGDKAEVATYIDMSGCYPLTRCYFEYNEEDGLYYRSQHLYRSTDGPHIDAETGEQLSFKNIIIQNIKQEELTNDYMVFQCHDTTRDGWFFTNGKGIHVTWEKTSDYGATRFYDDNGNEIILNTGKTMICVIEDGDIFTYR